MIKIKPDIEKQLRKAILDSKEMTRYRISKLTGVSETILSHFVNNKRSVTMTTAAKIAKVLDLELKPRQRKGK